MSQRKFEVNDTAQIPPDPDAGKIGRIIEIERSTYHWGHDFIIIEYPDGSRRTSFAYQLQGVEQPR